MNNFKKTKIFLLNSAVILASFMAFGDDEVQPENDSASSSYPAQNLTRVPQSMEQIHLSFSEVVKSVSPSIVNISALQRKKSQSLFLSDPFFSQFFNELAPSSRLSRSLGSAIVVNAEKGWVMTNAHVVGDAEEIRIQMDESSYEASLLWMDELLDLAIIEFDEKPDDLQAIEFADSDQLEVGDLALALGNPFGLGKTVTMGIISAVDRELPGNMGRYIQTDASINPGNSGGALVTATGKLIGLNTLIISRSGGSQGLGFATPSNLLNELLSQMQDDGTREQAWFGAIYQDINSNLSEALEYDLKGGAIVTHVSEKSNAAMAGLGHGDIIIEVNSRPVSSAADMIMLENYTAVGSQVRLTLSDGEIIIFEAAAPSENPPKNPFTVSDDGLFRFVTFVNRSPKVCHELRIPQGEDGIIIWDIQPNSIAHQMGFRRGDIIYSLNDVKLNDTKQLESDLSLRKGNRWIIEYERQGKRSIAKIRY